MEVRSEVDAFPAPMHAAGTWWASEEIAAAQVLVQRYGFRGWRTIELLGQQPGQGAIVAQRLA